MAADLGNAQQAVAVDVRQHRRHRLRATGGEPGQLACQRIIKAIDRPHPLIQLLPPDIDLGLTVIRCDDGRCGVLQCLPGVHTRGHAHRTDVARHGHFIGQQALCERGPRAGKVAPIVVVAHTVEVETQTRPAEPWQRIAQSVLVQQGVRPALPGAQAVVRHDGRLHLSLERGLQVAEFTIQVDAPFGHQRRRQGGIELGGNVPVIGQRQLQPAQVGQVDGRRQQARFAFVRERKTHVGRRKNGHALEVQRTRRGPACVVGMIQLQTDRFDPPVGHHPHGGQTGGVGGVVGHRQVLAFEVHP